MKFIHLADCHLADDFDFDVSNGDTIRTYNKKSFYSILKENKDVDFLMISGDLYERDYFTLSDYYDLFDKIEEFGKDIFYIGGNHDYIDSKNKAILKNRPDNLHLFPTDDWQYFEFGNTRIYGRSYAVRIINYEFDYDISLDKDYFNILLAHGDINTKNSSYLNMDIGKLKNMGFDYVGLGHIHKRENFGNNIYYSGSIEPHDFSDIYDYGYILYEDGHIYEKNSSFMKFYDIKIESDDFNSDDEIVDYMNSILGQKYNFLRLTLDKNLDKKYIGMIRADYIDLKIEEKTDIESLVQLFPNSLLEKYSNKFGENLDYIEKRALEIGLDAIYRSRDE